MGRFLSGAAASALAAAAVPFMLPGQLPTFGSGRYAVFPESDTFTVPAAVTSIRVRVLGGGAGETAGGASSFGNLISATGGQAGSGATPGQGGQGVGGDFQASGGPGGAGLRSGGGASGSELGAGGAGGAGSTGGAGGGGAVGGKAGGAGHPDNDTQGGSGASPSQAGRKSNGTNSQTLGGVDASATIGVGNNLVLAALPHPLFGFPGGGGNAVTTSGHNGGNGGGGAGGGLTFQGQGGSGGNGGCCAGGGGKSAEDGVTGQVAGLGGVFHPATVSHVTTLIIAGRYRFGGAMGGDRTRAGGGGGGYARGVFAVEPGQTFAVTVAQQNATASGGLVVVEY